MNQVNNTLRIRTGVGIDSYITVNLDQEYETLDILSLKIDQKGTYRYHVSDYGVVVGRVIANNGFGVPNARLSLFIKKNESTDIIKNMLYPYETSMDKNSDNIRYNLLPDKKTNDCHQVVGTFPNKRVVLDDSSVLEIFDEYYKYTTRTNEAGDYMFFGIPTGSYTLHMDLDISDCGKLSQRPRDFIYKGYTIEQFENPNQFKIDTDLSSLAQIFTQDTTVEVKPFWGDENEGTQIGITRKDIDISFKFEPTCVFMGSIVTDNPNEGLSVKCVPSHRMGEMSTLTTGPGTIEIIRKRVDNTIEELQIQGTQLINGNGVWCFQIPMNLDYVMTDEFGNTVPTDNPEKGIPTRCEVRFRLSLDESDSDAVRYFRSKVLIPSNPETEEEMVKNYKFGTATDDSSFRSLMWNNVYTIKSFIPRFQRYGRSDTRKFTGIKKVNIHGENNPMPYNNIRIKLPFMFLIICNMTKLFIRMVGMINKAKRGLMAISGWADVNITYSYITNELCPDLDNWYFAPGMVTNAEGKISEVINNLFDGDEESSNEETEDVSNNRVCKQWRNQSVCETFKEIAGEMMVYGTQYYELVGPNRDADTTVYIFDADDEDNTLTLPLFVTDIEKEQLFSSIGEMSKPKLRYTRKGKEKKRKLNKAKRNGLYEEANKEDALKYFGIDPKSTEANNGDGGQESVQINLTTNTDYLMQCVEMNLAQEYELINFDFYNDWINGCVYLPRWARDIKYKKKKKKGIRTIVPKRVKGCINNNINSRHTRRYFQQCSLGYNDDGQIISSAGCGDRYGILPNIISLNKLGCHKQNGRDTVKILGKNGGVVNESVTSLGHNVYYLKPYEWNNGKRIPLFATDIVMLGTLLDCNEYGIPSTFDSLLSTTYQMPPQLALTNLEDDNDMYYTFSGGAPTASEIATWKCNSRCDKGGQIVTNRISSGVQKQTPSYSDLDALMAERDNPSHYHVKYYEFRNDVITGENEVVQSMNVKYKADEVYYNNGSKDTNGNLIYIQLSTLVYNETYKYYHYNSSTRGYDEITGITSTTHLSEIYERENVVPSVVEYDDIFPVTEMSGVEWGYRGVGYDSAAVSSDTIDKLFAPGGHFFGLSCVNSETNIRSCVNLQRACEIGTSFSTRFEVPMGFTDKDEHDNMAFDVVNYLYVAPNGLISKDQIYDESFRSAFATMNQNGLKTIENEYGYKVYNFKYLLPDSFDGALQLKLSEAVYSNAYTAVVSPDVDKYWGDYVDILNDQLGRSNGGTGNSLGIETDIERGYTITRLREERSDDYVTFRMGDKPTFLIETSYGKSMPVFQNSFYFYFGLKDGATALDEFKTQYQATCAKNVIVEERGGMSIEVIGCDGSEQMRFNVKIKTHGLEAPYNVEFLKNGYNDYRAFSGNTTDGTWEVVNHIMQKFEGTGDEMVLNGVYPGDYTVTLQDMNGKLITQEINVGRDYIQCQYNKDTFVDFTTPNPYNEGVLNGDGSVINAITQGQTINVQYGGYMLGNFQKNEEFVPTGDCYYRLVLRMVADGDGKRYDDNDDIKTLRRRQIEEQFVWSGYRRIFWRDWVKNNRIHFWAPGTYELWVFSKKHNSGTIEYPKPYEYEYKLDEFIVKKPQTINYFLTKETDQTYTISNDLLLSLEQEHGKWWNKFPFNNLSNKTITDNKELYDLYNIVVSYVSQNSGETTDVEVIMGSNVDAEIWAQSEDTTSVSNNFNKISLINNRIKLYNIIGDVDNRQQVYITTHDSTNGVWSNPTLKGSVSNGYIISNNEYSYNEFAEYIRNASNNASMRKYLINGEFVECGIENDEIKINLPLTNNNIELVYLNNLPLIRKPFTFNIVAVMFLGGTIEQHIVDFVPNSISCYKNEMVKNAVFETNRVVVNCFEQGYKRYYPNADSSVYKERLFVIQPTTTFANSASYTNNAFVVNNPTSFANDVEYTKKTVVTDKSNFYTNNVNLATLWGMWDNSNCTNITTATLNEYNEPCVVEIIKYAINGCELMLFNVLLTNLS